MHFKIIAKDSDTCDCDEKYKYAINDAISRKDNTDLAALRARQASCVSRCNAINSKKNNATNSVATTTVATKATW